MTSAENRLARIARIIEQIDARCTARETDARTEMSKAEFRHIYRLAKGEVVQRRLVPKMFSITGGSE